MKIRIENPRENYAGIGLRFCQACKLKIAAENGNILCYDGGEVACDL